jgi:hypothetical protein
MKSFLLFLITVSLSKVYAQESCIIDTVETSSISYQNIDKFWLEGDNYILITRLEHGVKQHLKVYFRDSTIFIIDGIQDKCIRMSEKSYQDKDFNDISSDVSLVYTFYDDHKAKYIFDFVVIKKHGIVIQVVPFATRLSKTLECIDSQNRSLGNVIRKSMELVDVKW